VPYFEAKMHHIRFRLRLHLRPRWGSSQLDLTGPTSKEREGRGRRKEGDGREEKGREGGEGMKR